MPRHGDAGVVDGPDRVCATRRLAHLWQLEKGRWRSTARHAHVVAREAAVADAPVSARERAGAPERAYQPTP